MRINKKLRYSYIPKLHYLGALFFFCAFFLLFSQTALAKIGVGVGSGKIQVDEKLKPGMIYQLPPLSVLNTGDEESDYQLSIGYQNEVSQLRPLKDWFIFSPSEFHLKPGEVQSVDVKLNLPLKAGPGDYFCYLEAHPSQKIDKGNTTIGVAAAAKLYFTVVPANLVLGVYYKAASFWKLYAPWPEIVTVILALFFIGLIFKKFFKLQFSVSKKQEEKKDG